MPYEAREKRSTTQTRARWTQSVTWYEEVKFLSSTTPRVGTHFSDADKCRRSPGFLVGVSTSPYLGLAVSVVVAIAEGYSPPRDSDSNPKMVP